MINKRIKILREKFKKYEIEGYRSPGWDRYKKNKMIKWKK